jgi:glycosyltransferase involved in cell wall biosynthesis
LITVIATVLNEGENIRRLMESLAAQTLAPDEVVIVDGGSSDNTARACRTGVRHQRRTQPGDRRRDA